MRARLGELHLHASAAELARAAAEEFVRLASEAVGARGRFSAAITGGSSPVDLYRLLGEDSISRQVPWNEVHLFWGDDRVVPPAHPRSNYRLAEQLFLRRVPIPAGNVHRVRGELGHVRAARRYADELRDHFSGRPRFDLVHLGLGEDGHVASLFPFDTQTLLERARIAVPSLYGALGEWRVTLTYPVLNNARCVEFLVPSGSKARIAHTAIAGPLDPLRIPAQGVRPVDGVLRWRLTEEVAESRAVGPGNR